MESPASLERPEGAFLVPLRRAGLIAVLIGAVASVGLMIRAGQRAPRLLLLFMICWVLAPFLGLLVAELISKRWPVLVRAALYGCMLMVSLSCLVIFGIRVLRPPMSQGAFVFVAVPPLCWLLIGIVVSIAALRSRRRRIG